MKTHALTTPRIGYVHSWSSTQNEGWTRAALDYYKIPYTYFADKLLREGNLRAKYDVIVFPTVGGTAQSMLAGVGGNKPIPYKKTDTHAPTSARSIHPTISAAAWVLRACWSSPNSCRKAAP